MLIYRKVQLSSKGKEFTSSKNDMYSQDMENFTEAQEKFQTECNDHCYEP